MIAWNGSSRARRLGIAGAILCLASACETESAACGGEGDEAGGCLESVRLTYLNVRYDLDHPVFVNNRVPVEYGLTATSPDPATPQTRVVAVGFSFVEAEPADPANPIECGSNAFDVELLGDGEEHTFSGFIWPTTLCEALVGRAVNVRVDFDGGAELSESGIDYPSVTFTEAAREAELNQACRSVADPNATDAGRGCVYTVDLALTPSDESGSLIDVRYAGMAPASSVAILPYVEPGAAEVELLPSIVVQSTLVVNGRDPYVTGVAPEDVPPGLEELEPGITEDLRFGLDPSELDRLTDGLDLGDVVALQAHAELLLDDLAELGEVERVDVELLPGGVVADLVALGADLGERVVDRGLDLLAGDGCGHAGAPSVAGGQALRPPSTVSTVAVM